MKWVEWDKGNWGHREREKEGREILTILSILSIKLASNVASTYTHTQYISFRMFTQSEKIRQIATPIWIPSERHVLESLSILIYSLFITSISSVVFANEFHSKNGSDLLSQRVRWFLTGILPYLNPYQGSLLHDDPLLDDEFRSHFVESNYDFMIPEGHQEVWKRGP